MRAIDEGLERYDGLPLNSPREYPPYNGSMEPSPNALKRHLEHRIGIDDTARECMLAADWTDPEMNHTPRRSNGGLTAWEVFARRRETLRGYDRRKRQEVYGQLKENAVRIVTKLPWNPALRGMNSTSTQAAPTAWRVVVRAWLMENGLVSVKQ